MVKYTHESKETWKRELEDGSFEMYAIIYDEAGGYPLWHVGGKRFRIEDFDEREVTAAIEQRRPSLHGTTARFNLASALFETYFIDEFQHDEDFYSHDDAMCWVNNQLYKED